MIEIITQAKPDTNIRVCNNCKSILSYEDKDVNTSVTEIYYNRFILKSIICPQCGMTVVHESHTEIGKGKPKIDTIHG